MTPEQASGLEFRIYNCHTHLFTIDHIPKYFLSRFFPTTWARNKTVAKLMKPLVGNRYGAFLHSVIQGSSMALYQELRGYYPSNAVFVALSVDFDYMGAGPCKRNFMQQLQDLNALVTWVNTTAGREVILPFVCADPRRENVLDLVKQFIEQHRWRGIKMYPGLGFFPDNERLFPVYQYAVTNNIPVTVHCIPKNKNHFRFKPTEAMKQKVLAHQAEIEDFQQKELRKNSDFQKYCNHPYWYSLVLKQFPDLKIDLGHFGGSGQWDIYLDEPYDREKKTRPVQGANWYRMIRELIEKNKNVYADISFTVHDRALYPLLKNLLNSHDPNLTPVKERVLFGTDFYMLQKDYRERRFSLDVRGYLNDEEYWLIAERNPRRFLGL